MEDLELESYINNVDILMGGVPCQSFSQAGKRKGLEDKRGNLILTFIKMISTLNPKVFLIENVKGLKTHDKGKTLEKIKIYILSKAKLLCSLCHEIHCTWNCPKIDNSKSIFSMKKTVFCF